MKLFMCEQIGEPFRVSFSICTMCMCESRPTCATLHMQKSEDSFGELLFSIIGPNPGHQACASNTFTYWTILLALF